MKNPKHPFVDIGKWETCAEFQQKIVAGARQSSRFSDKYLVFRKQ